MESSSLARKAGMIGIIGAILWLIAVIMQYSLNLVEPDGSALWIVNELIFLTALACVAVGFLGLISGGAVANTFGKTVVILYAVSRGLIIIGGLANLFEVGQDSLLFVVFPIGGILSDISALLIGIAVVTAKRWTGRQRWMPLVHFLVIFFAVSLPLALGVTPDGPGMAGELIMGVMVLGVALAVFKSAANPRSYAVSPQAAQQ
ncbi:MAG TPA: hypothetical protein P5282_10850 [Anaerolineaceae bacterium]|nr:hypothetical protein [Anaerolineaceae bacterium]